jgi:hypothetical protein
VAEALLTLSEALDRAQSSQPSLELFNNCAQHAEQLSEPGRLWNGFTSMPSN